MFIKRLAPAPLKRAYRRARSYIRNRAYGTSNAEVFDKIYVEKAWGSSADSDVYSGFGTYDRSVTDYVEFVRRLIAENDIRTIVDVGCGDFAIGRQYAGAVEQYLGVDVSSVAIASNTERFASDKISFLCADASEQVLPVADLCLIRQVLQHLDNRSIERVLNNVRLHRLVLVTEHLPDPQFAKKPNLDKRAGPDTRLDFDSGVYVDLPPFNRPGQVVLNLPLEVMHAHPGEIMRSTLLRNR